MSEDKTTALAPADGARVIARKQAMDNMMLDVAAHNGEISQFLRPFGVDYSFFESSLRLFLTKQLQDQPDFFTSVTAISFMEALLRIAMNGLLADGKEAAIATYKGRATAMFMRDGFVKILWRTGLIDSIADQTVTRGEWQAGRFEYVEGDDGFVRHKMDLDRKDTDEVVAAYCVIKLKGGGSMREVVTKADLDKIAAMSRSPARKAWASQMHRKAAIRRIMGKMPREPAIAQLLQHDEANYDLTVVTPRETSGVRARLEAGGDATKPGFQPGHAESQTNPLAPDKLDEVLEGDRIPEAAEAPQKAEEPQTSAEPSERETPTSGPEIGPSEDDKLEAAVNAYLDRIAQAKTTIKLRSLREANVKLRERMSPERAEAVDAVFNRRWAEIEAGQ